MSTKIRYYNIATHAIGIVLALLLVGGLMGLSYAMVFNYPTIALKGAAALLASIGAWHALTVTIKKQCALEQQVAIVRMRLERLR